MVSIQFDRLNFRISDARISVRLSEKYSISYELDYETIKSRAHLGKEVMNTVQEEIDGGKTGSEKRAPPPMIIFGAEVEIGQENGGLGAGYDENDEDEKKKAEHIVGLMRPNAV